MLTNVVHGNYRLMIVSPFFLDGTGAQCYTVRLGK